MAVLTLAFSFALAPYPPLTHLNEVVNNLPLSFLAIATAFVCHEIAHKYMGQKYGYWSEFRMFPQGLLFALFLGVAVGIVFAAPGAVQIFGNPTREESGKMAAAGPATNLAISGVSTLLFFSSSGYLGYLFFFIAYINAFLAFFNLLPFGPLDGMKIFRWKKEVWILLLIISISMFIIFIT
jgi:Zn-dependent protease